MGDCLISKGVYQGISTDEHNRQRFHPLPYLDHVHGRFPQWFKDFSQDRQLKVVVFIFASSNVNLYFFFNRKGMIVVVINQLLSITLILI